MAFDAPLKTPDEEVKAEWIDHNGHLNMAYYNVLFDHGIDHLFERLGCGPAYVATSRLSFFTAETHICYLRELKQGEQVHTLIHLLEHDEKRLRIYQELCHRDGWVSATCEGLFLHVDLSGPKVVAMPEDLQSAVAHVAESHAKLAQPSRAGRAIRLSPGRTS
jgi:acyl-CoA thioester hydrolase